MDGRYAGVTVFWIYIISFISLCITILMYPLLCSGMIAPLIKSYTTSVVAINGVALLVAFAVNYFILPYILSRLIKAVL